MVENKKEANTAKVVGRGIPISAKTSCEICRAIRNTRLDQAKKLLQSVKEQKQPIAYKRFNSSASHRRGMGPGKYPIKAATEILSLLESAEANAQFKGLNTNDLVITESIANEGSRPHRYGRQRRRKAKRTHVTIVVSEEAPAEKGDKKDAKVDASKEEKKETPAKPKAEEKKEAPQPEVKAAAKEASAEKAAVKPKKEEKSDVPKKTPEKKESQGDKKE